MLTTPQVQPWCLRLRFSRQACEVIPYLRSSPSSRRVGLPTCAQRQWYLGATTLIGEGVL